jgi:hypothetical protein
MMAQAAAVAQGSVSSGCSRQSAAATAAEQAEAEWRAAARCRAQRAGAWRARGDDGGKGHGVGPQLLLHWPRWMTGRRWRAGSGHRRWKLWLLGAKDELLLPRRIAYQVSSAMDGGSL